MEKQRTIKELLEVMLMHTHYFDTGMCRYARELHMVGYITCDERDALQAYIHKHPPVNARSIQAFFENKYKSRDFYYWEDGDFKPREKWIKKHIKKLQ